MVNTFGRLPNVLILTKPNGGKAEALNYGIQQSLAEIVVTIDADTILLPNSISKLAQHFANPHVAAVAGNVKVGNRINLLTYWQANEYITTQNIERRLLLILVWINLAPKLSISPSYSTDFLHKVFIYFIVFTSLDILSSLQQLIYRQLISYVAIKTLFTALRGTLVKWSKNERKATVRNL